MCFLLLVFPGSVDRVPPSQLARTMHQSTRTTHRTIRATLATTLALLYPTHACRHNYRRPRARAHTTQRRWRAHLRTCIFRLNKQKKKKKKLRFFQLIEMPDEPESTKEVIQEGEWAEGVYVPPAEPTKPGSAKKKKKK